MEHLPRIMHNDSMALKVIEMFTLDQGIRNSSIKAWTKHNGFLREDRKKSDELMRELGLDILPESDFVDK